MIDVNRYIQEGSVKRDRIVLDIKRGRITENDIIALCQNSEIASAYFGKSNLEKIDRSLWNETYLDELSLASVSEVFCEEYLLYLYEVAQYVISKNEIKEQNNKLVKRVIVGIVIVVLVILAIASILLKTKKNTENYSVSATALAENPYLCIVRLLD